MQENKEEPILISVESAAKLMGVGRQLMLDIVKGDNFKAAVKLGKRNIKINKQQFIEWINSLTSAD